MTISYERKLALEQAASFMVDLIDPKKTPKISKEIRQRALSILKHYPSKYYIDIICERVPDHFSKTFNNSSVSPVVVAEIKKTINFKVGKANLEYVDVLPGYDQNADPCVSVIVYLKERHTPSVTSPIVPELSTNLRLMGEYRPVQITYRYISTLMNITA